jgi:hypothetical protein
VPKLRPEDRIRPGIPLEVALQSFRECVNQPGTIFSTDSWLLPNLELLHQLMHNPIIVDEAVALIDVLYQRHTMRTLIEWLKEEPVSWEGHFIRAALQVEEALSIRMEELRKLDEEWEHINHELDVSEAERESAKEMYSPQAMPCPSCGIPPEHLEWLHYSSPPSTWANLCGLAGWKTRCRVCLREVGFFMTLRN